MLENLYVVVILLINRVLNPICWLVLPGSPWLTGAPWGEPVTRPFNRPLKATKLYSGLTVLERRRVYVNVKIGQLCPTIVCFFFFAFRSLGNICIEKWPEQNKHLRSVF